MNTVIASLNHIRENKGAYATGVVLIWLVGLYMEWWNWGDTKKKFKEATDDNPTNKETKPEDNTSTDVITTPE